ncbi:MAG: hypothetical protein FJ087_14430 [Deltaproteobacteria bacterium]|nr:hypothetical protein [Deltaproteobacteria bacterium]
MVRGRLLLFALALHAVAAALATPRDAAAGWADMVQLGGYLSSDIRYTIDDWRGPRGSGTGWYMNRNEADFRLKLSPDPRVTGVVETKLRFYGFNNADDVGDLSDRAKVDPFDVRLEEAWVAVRPAPWMDIKVGRMIQSWGSVDMFNPTDNLNARDFSDPLDYASKVPNQMIELDFYPTNWLTLTAVWVPVFKPSMLPPSAVMGFAVEYDSQGCFAAAPTPPLGRADVDELFGYFGALDRCKLSFLPTEVRTVEPELDIANSQAAARAKFQIGDLDLSLSYYYGRFTFPIAYTAVAELVSDGPGTVQGKTNVKYQAEVMYPRMQVAGLDFSYSAPWFFDVGFVGELAVIFPERVDFALLAKPLGDKVFSSVNVPSTPFVKASAGLDYTFTKWLYVNAMYVRGFFDEFNDRFGLHNYTVLPTELKFFEDELQIRLAGALDCNDLSAVTYPQITWVAAPSLEFIAGVMLFIGDTKPADGFDYGSRSKFGQKAAGRDFVFFKTKFTW